MIVSAFLWNITQMEHTAVTFPELPDSGNALSKPPCGPESYADARLPREIRFRASCAPRPTAMKALLEIGERTLLPLHRFRWLIRAGCVNGTERIETLQG